MIREGIISFLAFNMFWEKNKKKQQIAQNIEMSPEADPAQNTRKNSHVWKREFHSFPSETDFPNFCQWNFIVMHVLSNHILNAKIRSWAARSHLTWTTQQKATSFDC